MEPEQSELSSGEDFLSNTRKGGRHLVYRACARSGLLTRLLMYPNPRWAPVNRPHVTVSRFGGFGDSLLCTPALRELKRRNPNGYVVFYTNVTTLLQGLPYIDELHDSSTTPAGCIHLSYESFIPPQRHIAEILGDRMGVRVTDVRPDCMIDAELINRFRREWDDLPRPKVIINRNAGPWTGNKDWPDELWDDLIHRLAASGTIIETGSAPMDYRPRSGAYVNLTGRLKLAEYAAAIAASDLHVGPISAGVHIAAASRVPAVVIYGGYEHPVCSAYPGNINLYSPVPCAPCWLRTPCPYTKKCLWQITPEQVEAAVQRLWKTSH
jgi:ADP-heptose:LPS heptosyltransferase